jgi:hypothetical protein
LNKLATAFKFRILNLTFVIYYTTLAEFSLLYVVETGSGIHPTYPMVTEDFFPGGKAAGA